ncbi:hypothetical protein DL98DRAFT_282525 [Cadophora sp. DSE1049]|nr:hypothetical protein DL98DRAFT_282525 [Cadophora sp. DSE1049]
MDVGVKSDVQCCLGSFGSHEDFGRGNDKITGNQQRVSAGLITRLKSGIVPYLSVVPTRNARITYNPRSKCVLRYFIWCLFASGVMLPRRCKARAIFRNRIILT